MRRLQYSISKKETGNASGKAKNDATDIALRMGFELSYNPSEYRPIRIIQQFISMRKFKKENIIFFQYPAVDVRLMEAYVKAKNKNSKSIMLVHDLPSIQGVNSWSIETDIKWLSNFDCVIVHNNAMKKYVEETLEYKGEIVILGLFDYLHDPDKEITTPCGDRSVSFAGNPSKAKFLMQLGDINTCRFLLYGNKGNADFSEMPNVEYKGLLPSDQIQYLMEGDYGLVWDGDSIETCAGPNGEYLRYNNPHKLSLCMAAGKPVITWKQSAIADFIQKHNVGIVVDSLKELNDIDLAYGYEEMRHNVLEIKKKVADGYYLSTALEKAISIVTE